MKKIIVTEKQLKECIKRSLVQEEQVEIPAEIGPEEARHSTQVSNAIKAASDKGVDFIPTPQKNNIINTQTTPSASEISKIGNLAESYTKKEFKEKFGA